MMTRRQMFLSHLAIAALATVRASAESRPVTLNELRAVFESRPREAGRMIQRSLKGTGYYEGAIDGLWGPQMEQAFARLMASERYRRHAPTWTWPHDVKVTETLFFTTTDAYP